MALAFTCIIFVCFFKITSYVNCISPITFTCQFISRYCNAGTGSKAPPLPSLPEGTLHPSSSIHEMHDTSHFAALQDSDAPLLRHRTRYCIQHISCGSFNLQQIQRRSGTRTRFGFVTMHAWLDQLFQVQHICRNCFKFWLDQCMLSHIDHHHHRCFVHASIDAVKVAADLHRDKLLSWSGDRHTAEKETGLGKSELMWCHTL